jgi:hypothetical protein
MNSIYETFVNASPNEAVKASMAYRKQMLKKRWVPLHDYHKCPNRRLLERAFREENNLLLAEYIDDRLRDKFLKKTRKKRKPLVITKTRKL